MRYHKDGYSVEAAIRKGRKLPDWYLDEPPEYGLDIFYMSAFWKLNSTRRFKGGPIPWSEIRDFGAHIQLDNDVLDPFISLIMSMDDEYVNYQIEQQNSP